MKNNLFRLDLEGKINSSKFITTKLKKDLIFGIAARKILSYRTPLFPGPF
jgi:hypothetical protein